MEAQVTIVLPQFAPLSVPMALHLLGLEADEFVARVTRPADQFLCELHTLEQQILKARDHIFSLLRQKQDISVKWFRATVPSLRTTRKTSDKPLSLQAIANWRESNALRFRRWGEMDLDSASAVMIMALIDKRERHFLPTSTPPDEPIWWCYSQAAPTRRGTQAPIIPRPVPLPQQLEPGTLLWSSSWPSFDPDWTQFSGVGAIRFSSVTKDTLELWDPGLSTSQIALLLEGNDALRTEQTVRSLAQSVLYKLAVGRVGVPSPSLPLLWKRAIIWPN